MTRDIKRAAALPVAVLLFLTPLGTALGAHPCPHHDGAAAAGGTAGTAPEHHPVPASDHEHDANTRAATDAGPGSEAHGACTCMGQCQTSAAPSMPAPALGSDLPAPPAAPAFFRPARPPLRATIVPFSLPWGNAPPTL
jgi:hypothetical protein